MSRKKRSCLPPFLTIVLILLIGVITVVIIKIPADAASIFGEPFARHSFLERLSLSVSLLNHQQELLTPSDPFGQPVSLTIASGESVASIANRMQQIGLIADAGAWIDYLVYSGLDYQLQAGSYRLSPALSPVDIAAFMQDPKSREITFSILPGWRLEEIAASLPASGLEIDSHEFILMSQTGELASLDARLPGSISTLEGFYMPGQYTVTRAVTLQELVSSMIDRFFGVVTIEVEQAFASQGLNLEQAVILASIVEREAVLAEEMPLISSVFLNRLAVGMRLESDPTVQYALGYDHDFDSWWKVPLDGDDLAINSTYNTYLYSGLPPTPICNPGAEALLSVAQPETTAYYFFRAACDDSGHHLFAETYEEHLNNGCD